MLNFLYITNPNDWNFSRTPKETLHFYFPNFDKNYIIFEIHKNYSFCILIKREIDNKLVYYKIDRAYSDLEQDIFVEKEGGVYLLDFESIERNLIGYIHKYDRKDYSKVLYGDSKRDKTVLWLSKNIKHSTFSRIYKNLLNTKSLTNSMFKESLLIADGKEESKITFNNVNNQNINKMRRLLQESALLEKIKPEFLIFKENYSQHKALSVKIERYNATKSQDSFLRIYLPTAA